MKRRLISKHVEVEGFDSLFLEHLGTITETLGVQVDHLIKGRLNRKDVMLSPIASASGFGLWVLHRYDWSTRVFHQQFQGSRLFGFNGRLDLQGEYTALMRKWNGSQGVFNQGTSPFFSLCWDHTSLEVLGLSGQIVRLKVW